MLKKLIIVISIISAIIAGLEAGIYASYAVGLRTNNVVVSSTSMPGEEETEVQQQLKEKSEEYKNSEEGVRKEYLKEKTVYITSVGSFVTRNIVTCFAFSPSLSIMDVMKQIKAENLGHDTLYKWLTVLYAFVIFAAPICTASAFYVFFGTLISTALYNLSFWIKGRKYERIILIGNSRTALSIAEHERDDAKKQREVLFITEKEFTHTEKLQFLKKRIRVIQRNMANCEEQEFKKIIKKIARNPIHGIILAEQSSSCNFSIYMRLMTISREYLSEETMICCRCGDKTFNGLFSEFYMDHPKCIPPKVFSLSELRAYSILENMPLPIVKPDETLRVMIAGFSETGRQLLQDIAYMGICSRTNGIEIDVVDQNIDACKTEFLKNLSSKVFEISENQCVLKDEFADGSFVIHFHKMDITGNEFLELLKKKTYDYHAICIEDIETSVHGVVNINRLFEQTKHKISVSLMTDPEIAVYLQEDNQRYENVFISGTKTFLNIDYIMHKTIEDQAKKFHETYQRLSPKQSGWNTSIVDWNKLDIFLRMDNRFVSRHQTIKEKIVDLLLDKDKSQKLESYFGPKGKIFIEKGNEYLIQNSEKEIAEKIMNDAFLTEMAAIEQRRWCYCRALNGWTRAENIDPAMKDDKDYKKMLNRLKQTLYLVKWDDLCQLYGDKILYNLMPLILMRYQERVSYLDE